MAAVASPWTAPSSRIVKMEPMNPTVTEKHGFVSISLANARSGVRARRAGNVSDAGKTPTDPATRDRLELQELTHGRLAMIAFAGMIHQVFVTGKPVLASLGDIFA